MSIAKPYMVNNSKRKRYLKFELGSNLDILDTESKKTLLGSNNVLSSWDDKPKPAVAKNTPLGNSLLKNSANSVGRNNLAATDVPLPKSLGGTGSAGTGKVKAPRTKGGGGTGADGAAGAVGTVAAIGTSVLDSVDPGSGFTGRQSTGTQIAKGALTGASAGATIGSFFPGAGTLIGGVVGGVVGGAVGAIGGASSKKKEKAAAANAMAYKSRIEGSLNAKNPEDYSGNVFANYAANGGRLKTAMSEQATVGGDIVPKNSTGSVVEGRSHNSGGVKIPAIKSEVEGGETIFDDGTGPYVFSKKLGFAQEHKKLMAMKTKIENKPPTKERLNSIALLGNREQALKRNQEQVRTMLGLS